MAMKKNIEFNMVAGLIFLAGLGAGLKFLYSQTMLDLFYSLFVEEYSYIFIVIFAFFLFLALRLGETWVESEFRIGRVFVILLMLSTLLTFNVLSKIIVSQSIILQVLSLIFFVWVLTVILYMRNSLKKLILPMFTLVMLVPIPRDMLEYNSLFLSKIVGNVVSVIANVPLRSLPGNRVLLDIVDKSGRIISLEIVSACSGIVSVASLIAILPFLIYATSGESKVFRRIKAIFIGLFLGIIIAFVGNIFRVLLIVYITEWYGFNTAMEFFHYTPSMVYSIIATFIAFYAASKLCPNPVRRHKNNVVLSNVNFRRSIVLLMIFVLVSSISMISAGIVPVYASFPRKVVHTVYSYDYLISNISGIVFNDKVHIIYEQEVPALMRALGSSLVKRFMADFGEYRVFGYLEFAETPLRFHSWWVCLTVQGYEVLSSWEVKINDTMVTYILYKKYGVSSLMGVAYYSVPVMFGEKIDAGYLRVSLMMQTGKSVSETVKVMNNIFSNYFSKGLYRPNVGGNTHLLHLLAYIDIFLAVIVIAYYGTIIMYNYIKRFR